MQRLAYEHFQLEIQPQPSLVAGAPRRFAVAATFDLPTLSEISERTRLIRLYADLPGLAASDQGRGGFLCRLICSSGKRAERGNSSPMPGNDLGSLALARWRLGAGERELPELGRRLMKLILGDMGVSAHRAEVGVAEILGESATSLSIDPPSGRPRAPVRERGSSLRLAGLLREKPWRLETGLFLMRSCCSELVVVSVRQPYRGLSGTARRRRTGSHRLQLRSAPRPRG